MSQEKNSYQNEYRTGGSIRRRSYGALFAVGVFVLLTFFGMLLTAGLLIIRANPFGEHRVIASISIPEETQSPDSDLHMEGLVMDCRELGITCQAISEFCEKYYELPSGIYIIRVGQHTPAAHQGILPGDVLVKANGAPVDSPGALQELIDACPVGETMVLEFVRKEKAYTVNLTPGA